MKLPSLADIDEAESRLDQDKSHLEQSVDRTESALHDALVRPSTLVLVALASGACVLWASRRSRATSATKSVPKRADSASPQAPRPGFLQTLISAYGVRMLNFAFHHGLAAWKEREARSKTPMPNLAMSKPVTGGDPTAPEHAHRAGPALR